MLQNIDQGNMCGAVMLDLRKAFDLVNHDILIHKLSKYGVSDNSCKWFHSYLTNRYQVVSYNGHLSEPLPIKSGVPQGSILGPLLFILFVNDFILEIHDTQLGIYADDSTNYVAAKSVTEINDKLNAQLVPISNWIDDNKMVLNVDKSEAMLFGTKCRIRKSRNQLCIGINDTKLKSVDTHKLLGIHLDKHLTWNIHIDKLFNKAKSLIFLFRKIKYLLPFQARIQFF